MKTCIAIAVWCWGMLLWAQPTTLIWQHIWTEPTTDTRLEKVIITTDNNYLVGGYRSAPSNGLDYNFLVAKFLPDSDVPLWTSTLGGSGEEKVYDIIELPDGGVVAVGQSNSPDGDVGTLLGSYDAWVVRLDATGNLVWARVFGGSNADIFNAVCLTPDNQLLVVGNTESTDGDLNSNKGYKDVWIAKIALENGASIWQKTIGGSQNDVGNSVLLGNDGTTAYVGGYSSSNDFDVSGNHGGKDFWLGRISLANGDLLWQRCYGGSQSDGMTDMTYIEDGNLALFGDSLSNDGDVGINNGLDDYWTLAINPQDNGNVLWRSTIGFSSFDQSRSLLYTPNHRLLLTGITFDSSLVPPNYMYDIFFCQLNSLTGALLWSDNVGGSLYDTATSTVPAINGSGYFSVGNSDSQDGDIDIGGGNSDRHGMENGFMFHFLEPNIGINSIEQLPAKIYTIPAVGQLCIELPATVRLANMLLYNAAGQVVLSQKVIGTATFSVTDLPSGVYAVALLGVDYHFGQMVVIE